MKTPYEIFQEMEGADLKEIWSIVKGDSLASSKIGTPSNYTEERLKSHNCLSLIATLKALEGQEKKRDVAIWMRNYGIDDDSKFSAGEVEEILQNFVNDSTLITDLIANLEK